MEQVTLGNTGISVSRLCFGTLTVGPLQANLSVEDGGRVLAHGIDRGINFFDTAELYETYPYIKKAMELTGNREIVVSSKSYAYSRELAHKAVEDARQQLDRDYIDIFKLHETESIHTLNGHLEALEVFMEYQQKGIIRAVGASMHHIAAVEGAIELELDIIHPLLNKNGLGIVDGTREEMEQALIKAHQAGIGIFAMKPLAGGNLFKEAERCLDYIFSQPYVDAVAIGMQSTDEVDANIQYVEEGAFSEAAKTALEKKTRHLHIDDWCVGCGVCVSRCSQQALSVENGMAVCAHEKCVLCGYCCSVCDMWAIKVV